MKKHGFTLIELLAVIVILAIIALISVPIILNVIEKAKKGALSDSAYGIIESGNLFYMNNINKNYDDINEKYKFEIINNKFVNIDNSDEVLSFKGTVPKSGELQITISGKTAIAICNDDYCACKSFSEKKVTIKENNCSINSDTGEIDESNSTDNSALIGTIISYLGKTKPDGYLLCDGSIYNISSYKKLADFIKKEFGTYNYFGGDGVNTFAVPNLLNTFLKGSTEAGKSEDAGLPEIEGTITPSSDVGFRNNTSSYSGAFYPTTKTRNHVTAGSKESTVVLGFKASLSNSIYGSSETVTPKNMSILYCIKY